MAGYGLPPHALQSPSPSNRPLPTGPCGHNDATGPCGCDGFWDKTSAELHQDSKEHRSSSERSTWCVCGHHACFHKRSAAVAPTRAPARCDGRCRQQGTQCEIHRSWRSRRDELPSQGSQPSYNAHLKPSHPSASQRVRDEASHANGTAVNDRGRDAPSQPSTSGLPPVPSMCLMSNDRYSAANSDARGGPSQSRQTIAGLGLSLMNLETAGNSTNRPQSVASTVPDDIDISRLFNASNNEHELPSTRANSVAGELPPILSPAPGPLDIIQEYNRILHVDVSGDTVPNTFNPEDFIQSATEVATPSIANTPDLTAADQAIRDGKQFVEGFLRQTSNAEPRIGADARPASATSAPTPQLLLTSSPKVAQEQLQQIIKSSSPQALQKLVSYLTPLHNLLHSMPNVANTMEELNGRLALLENNNSFNYVHPDELQQHFESFEGRLIDLENRLDEHDKLHQAIDQDHSSLSNSRCHIATITDSFGSNCSIQSTTSSALILATMDRKDVETTLGGIKDRLDVLEAAAMPTSINPWEVEVVLLPWGRDLRGIWFSSNEPMHDPMKATTQDSEEWTQARSSTLDQSRLSLGRERETDSSPLPETRHSSRSSHPFSDTESGWSSQAISDWAAGSADELLSPKACGSKNLVYKRLRSRGFIKDVTFTSASSKDIQSTLSRSFDDLLEHLKYTDEDENPTISLYPGLRASFVPLRKVIKDSRLRFLTPAEMSSSALWSAQFLSSGIIMRVSGGKKRLYVTQREAYIQAKDQMGSSWTWQEIRQLPRQHVDPDSQMEGNYEHCQPQVPEADAREACWSFYAAYDAEPPSLNTSFGSHHSVELELSMRPSDRSWRRSMTPTSILKNRQPISPLSEFHPQRPGYARNRTASASLVEPAVSSSAKRRLNSSPVKQSSAPQTASRATSVNVTRLKRRRVNDSSSPRVEAQAPVEQVAVWSTTPRRSREPPSPFFSEPQVPLLPRTNSDLASRPSQRSAALVGKNTPLAYATPHSGLFNRGDGFGGGDTEADDDLYQDEDGEQSWHGVVTGDDSSGSSSDEAEAGAEVEPASFSGDDDPFGTEADDDDDSGEEEDGLCEQRQKIHVDDDGDDSDKEDEIFDTLLGVLRD
ncbi:hypothetical protein K458DRAFT_380078 [Lentithecium fluviatile CBS 122367]|uniref:Uncharacterized protein n=1 Tax=Lentithecium fluviatile CBS 122367 TaxID=1168545 RepID=A0A6G1IE62_9PLEO|nr:hypothetical protein K458DRAFT_380078 [Lentithecium fluviatile CBS 122367]